MPAGFKYLIRQVEPVAQSVEHVTFNHGVQGSNPCGLTNKTGWLVRHRQCIDPLAALRGEGDPAQVDCVRDAAGGTAHPLKPTTRGHASAGGRRLSVS
jgi:hypothetical protein